jgi:copper/silver efflux system protein
MLPLAEAIEVLRYQDMAIAVGAGGGQCDRQDRSGGKRAGPGSGISMIETVIDYQPEYLTDADGRRINFRYDRQQDTFVRDDQGRLIPDPAGRPYRQWRDHIQSPQDIWAEIVRAAEMPGATQCAQASAH